MKTVVIADACRTAIGSMGGALKPLSACELATAVLKGMLERSGLEAKVVDEVILGHCRQTSDDPNIARIAALAAGIPETTPAYTVMRQCASGMTAVQNGALSIMGGLADAVIAGGTESMSNAVFYLRNARWGVGNGNTELIDALTEGQYRSQPQPTYGKFNMGSTAENIAEKLQITREEQDLFALASHQKAIAAIESGRFADEIIPVAVPQGKRKEPVVFDTDECPRKDTGREKMSRLKPCFNISHDGDGRLFPAAELTGSVTAANSSSRNDGASAMLLLSDDRAAEFGIKPIARIIGMGVAGCDPRLMGLGPVYAVPKALKNAGITSEDLGLIEMNEAFAAQTLGCVKQLGWENKTELINVNGGAIALGHPVGSSGCRILVTLVHEMEKRGVRYGLATLCIAGGMGQATVVELL
jgi:acetyl-CoA C-acetyltransferase